MFIYLNKKIAIPNGVSREGNTEKERERERDDEIIVQCRANRRPSLPETQPASPPASPPGNNDVYMRPQRSTRCPPWKGRTIGFSHPAFLLTQVKLLYQANPSTLTPKP